MAAFPGATAVSRVQVYDWPTVDGKRGGTPHLHTASTEGYVVLAGTGVVETLSHDGVAEHPLSPGTVLWFTPGTVHRLVTHSGGLDILVVMQNSGLPEAGDAVLTFPQDVLTDPGAYARAAAAPCDEAAARSRRDLAIDGYLRWRARVLAEGLSGLDELHQAAAALVRDHVAGWRHLWRERALAEAERTGDQLRHLADGRPGHLAESAVLTAPTPEQRYGMCGHLRSWDLHGAH